MVHFDYDLVKREEERIGVAAADLEKISGSCEELGGLLRESWQGAGSRMFAEKYACMEEKMQRIRTNLALVQNELIKARHQAEKTEEEVRNVIETVART